MTADDPRKRQFDVKHGEAEAIKAQMWELQRRRETEHKEMMSESGQYYRISGVKIANSYSIIEGFKVIFFQCLICSNSSRNGKREV